MSVDFTSLPRVSDSISYLYIEHAMIEQDMLSVVALTDKGRVPIPVKSICCLILGPGTNITHAAMRSLSESGCFVMWTGESMRKFYAYGTGETRSSKRLLHQVMMYADTEKHLDVAKRMYAIRFPDADFSQLSLQQMRGAEGIRVKEAYKNASLTYGIPWYGRKYRVGDTSLYDAVNESLTLGNDLLYAVCEAVIVSLGYSSAIGFIHTGKTRSFVFDVADIYKAEMVIPAAFEVAGSRSKDIAKAIRVAARRRFKDGRLLSRLPKDIAYILGDDAVDVSFEGVNDLWDLHRAVSGGVNYADAVPCDIEDDAVW